MGIALTYLGHSGFLLDAGGTTVAIDPFLSGNPLAPMTRDAVRCQAMVLTHGHPDHMTDAEAIAKRNDAVVFCAWEIHEYLTERGIRTEPMNHGGRVPAPWGWVAFTQAVHSSSFGGRYMGAACGTVVHLGDVTVYHCGDTDLFSDMKLIAEIYQPDIAMIPIGDRFTMGPDLASRAAEWIKPRVAIPIHYRTFPLLVQDASGFKPKGVTVRVLDPGERWSFAP
jgi:L-ascorbate metabolism protein UlaG (beta-lactamase superfamily)